MFVVVAISTCRQATLAPAMEPTALGQPKEEIYLRPGKSLTSGESTTKIPVPLSSLQQDKVDIGHLRARAEKASTRQGKFIMPFSFGVAPLLQVFGADIPVVPYVEYGQN